MYEQDSQVQCFVTVLQAYVFGLLESFASQNTEMQSSVWRDGLRDFAQWTDQHWDQELKALYSTWDDLDDLYVHALALFGQSVGSGLDITKRAPFKDFIRLFLAAFVKLQPVVRRKILNYSRIERRQIALDALRLTMLRLYKTVGSRRYDADSVILPEDSASQLSVVRTALKGLHSTVKRAPSEVRPSRVRCAPSAAMASRVSRESARTHRSTAPPPAGTPQPSPCFWEQGARPSFDSATVVQSVRSGRR